MNGGVLLHGLSLRHHTLWDWHAMALGELTVLAFRSKETGFIIAWLALSFLWHDGRINAKRFLVPTFLASVFVLLILAPMKSGELGGSADRHVEWMAAAFGVLLVITTIVVILRRSAFRLVLLIVSVILFFGPGVHLTHRSLARHTAAQRGELTLYPWRAFENEIRAERPKTIQVSPRLVHRFQMIGQGRGQRT